MQIIGTLTPIENGTNIEQQYPSMASGQGEQYTFSTETDTYTLIIVINFQSERLYYKIRNSASEFKTRFNTLIEGVNMMNGIEEGYQLQYRGNSFYFGDIEEDLDALLQNSN